MSLGTFLVTDQGICDRPALCGPRMAGSADASGWLMGGGRVRRAPNRRFRGDGGPGRVTQGGQERTRV